ncbi:hypothetical protein GHT56_21560 [Pseudomonas aeruginosa]|nr:hypothetical protein [Pseudomonas aeruginosa]MBG4198233.1 hypothetical protein [Pseudomonas aeruginosa]
MTPEQFIKLAILQTTARWDGTDIPSDLTAEQVEARYEELVEQDAHWDARNDVRCGCVETNIEPDYSRHYESKSVAAKINGRWVGWTYWYGGGKHGEPEAIDWMDQAYFLDCTEEERVVTIRTFSKLEALTA